MRTWRLLTAAVFVAAAAGPGLVAPPAVATDLESSATPASTGSVFTPVSPVRVLDTRGGPAAGPGQTVTVDLSSRLPASATAVVLNVTGVAPTVPTFVTVFPHGVARPTASSLNLAAGETRPMLVTVAVPADRRVSLYNNAGSVHLVADLTGYYATGAGSKFTALQPERVLDTRVKFVPVGPGGSTVLDLTGKVPASATAVTFNLTGTGATAPTYVTAWPTGTARPTASNLNLLAQETRPNLVTVALGAGRRVSLYNNAGSVHLMADIAGFYTPDYGATFTPMTPSRVLDTRDGTGTGGDTSPVGPRSSRMIEFERLPSTATAVMLNVTGVGATAATFVLAGPRYSGAPAVSTLNLAAGQVASNSAAVVLDQGLLTFVYNHAGSVHLVADLYGWFEVSDPPCAADCVFAWGDNRARQLGTGQAGYLSEHPAPMVGVGGGAGVRTVAGSQSANGYAVRTDGTVWAWGGNGLGQLGNGWSGFASFVPVPVVGLSDVTAVAAGSGTGYALLGDGTVWAWGQGTSGQLGDGAFRTSDVPVQVSALDDVVAIAAGSHNGYALRADGTVWAWGANHYGQLGNGEPGGPWAEPGQVVGLAAVSSIAAGGDTAYALLADGTVWAWGGNGDGQLGNGVPCDGFPCISATPVQAAGLNGVTAVVADGWHGFALRQDGTVWGWGNNANGGLGNGVDCRVCESRVPVQVSGLTGVRQVAAFSDGGYALREDGTVWAWGDNLMGSLGVSRGIPYSTVPVQVAGLTGVSAIAGGGGAGRALVPGPA